VLTGLLPIGATPPASFTKIGTTVVPYRDLASRNLAAIVDLDQEN
jgi:hypothetical protein